jgi:hypothetical protein
MHDTHRMHFWEWTKNYLALDTSSQNEMLTHRQFVLEIPSFLVHPLAPTILIKSVSLDTTDTTWKLASDDLWAAIDCLWESLEPNSEKIFGNAESLPSSNNPSSLPYHDTNGIETFLLESIPDGVIPKPKLDPKKPVECCLCAEKIVLNKMRNHVGTHILHSLRGTGDPKPCSKQAIGENPCGFCGLEGCLTQLQERKKGSLSVASNCQYHYAAMNYKAAAKFSKEIPCTNVPVHCPLCPTSVFGQSQTIWKYNAMYHLIHEHSIGDTSPPIPGQMLVQIFVTKEEERALGIQEQVTTSWRKQNNIPDSDGFEVYSRGGHRKKPRHRVGGGG